MNSRHQTNNLLQGSHSRGVIFGHEERQALARMTNIESLDGTIQCERTPNGWAIGAQPAPLDTVATLSWDAVTEVATVRFDFIYQVNYLARRRLSGYAPTDANEFLADQSLGYAHQPYFEIDLSGISWSGSTDHGILFCLPSGVHDKNLYGHGASGASFANFQQPDIVHADMILFASSGASGATVTATGRNVSGEYADSGFTFDEMGFTSHTALLQYYGNRQAPYVPICTLMLPVDDGTLGTPRLTNHFGKTRTCMQQVPTPIVFGQGGFHLNQDVHNVGFFETNQPGEGFTFIGPSNWRITTLSVGDGSGYLMQSVDEVAGYPAFILSTSTGTVLVEYTVENGYLKYFELFPGATAMNGRVYNQDTTAFAASGELDNLLISDDAGNEFKLSFDEWSGRLIKYESVP